MSRLVCSLLLFQFLFHSAILFNLFEKLVKVNFVVDESSFGVFVPLLSRHLAQLGFHIAVSLDAVAVVVVEVVGNWACG